MSTKLETLELRLCHNSSDSSLPTNNSPSNEQARMDYWSIYKHLNDRKFLGVSSNNCQYLR